MPQAKTQILFFLLIISAASAFAQNPSDAHSQIRNFLEARDYKAAAERLIAIREERPKDFSANNYDYLLARVYENLGDFASAGANYQSVVNRNSSLKEYALWHLSEIARSSGNLFLERLYLEELSRVPEESLLLDVTGKRLARSNFESGHYDVAINLLDQSWTMDKVSADKKGKPGSREDLVLLAQAYYQNKNLEKARETFLRLIEETPNENQPDDFALAGVKGLDLLDVGAKNLGKVVGKLSDQEHFSRAFDLSI